jgi:hypothetical protein
MIRYPSAEWIAAWVAAINDNATFRREAARFDGDLGSRVRADPERGVPQDIFLWFKARGGRLVDFRYDCDESLVRSAIVRTDAPYDVWKDLMRGELDLMRALLTGKVRLHGNRRAALRLWKAVAEMNRLAGAIPTEFVDDQQH